MKTSKKKELIRIRNESMLIKHIGGESCASIARDYNLSRERVRQVLKLLGVDKKDVKINREKRKLSFAIKRHGSLEKYEKYKERKKIRRLISEGKISRWNIDYEKCLRCGSTDKPHRAKGFCNNCYDRYLYHTSQKRRDASRRASEAYRLANMEKVYKTQKKYMEKYMQRPGVKERLSLRQKEYDNRPEIKARRKAYSKEYFKRPEVIARLKIYDKKPEVIERRRKRAKELYNKKKKLLLNK